MVKRWLLGGFVLVCSALLGCSQDSTLPTVGFSPGVGTIDSEQEVRETIDNLMRITDYVLHGSVLSAPTRRVYVKGAADGSIETETHEVIKGAPRITP